MHWLVRLLLVACGLGLIGWGIWSVRPDTSPAPATEESEEDQGNNPAPEPTSTEPPAEPEPAPTLVYPMTEYETRITVRGYGQRVTAADRQGLSCGAPFEGLHTGDDLEATGSADLAAEIPVYAIADGTVRQVRSVSGYGGLIVIEHELGGAAYTAYYGHVDLASTALSPGDTVAVNQEIAVLGAHCSAETSNERKHLHFAIRRGTDIDVRGYVQSQSTLSEWVDPTELLTSLDAVPPGN